MNKKNFVLLPIILPIVLAILALPTAAFGDTVKCKDNGDNNCNKIKITAATTKM